MPEIPHEGNDSFVPLSGRSCGRILDAWLSQSGNGNVEPKIQNAAACTNVSFRAINAYFDRSVYWNLQAE